MSEITCEVVKITHLNPLPDSDFLSLTHIYSYPVITRTGSIKVGDKAVYFPVDAKLPDKPIFRFIWKDKKDPTDKQRTIKAIRLRGTFSMGLCLPFHEVMEAYPELNPDDWQVGHNIAAALGVEKYEPPEPVSMGGENERSPGWFPHYTDIENLRKYHPSLRKGEEVILTEKIHGCVPSSERIRMADGTTKRISKIRVGDLVLGVNDEGNVVASEVLNTFNNGKAEKWLSIKMTEKGLGRGGHCVLKCTPEHEIFCPTMNEYIPAKQLEVGMKVLCTRKDLALTPVQEQVLLGKVLGDGYIHLSNAGQRAAVTYSHCLRQKEYIGWTQRALGSLSKQTVRQQKAGFEGSNGVYSTGTVQSCFIKDLVRDFVLDGQDQKIKKRVPGWLPDRILPIAIAFWYMDDGSMNEGRDEGSNPQATFATHGFAEEDQDTLIKSLAKFGIEAKKQHTEGRIRLRITTDSAERLFLLVAPFIPPCMQYKLPERYRGHEGWLPDVDSPYKGSTLEQTVLSIEDVTHKIKSYRYNIETETHNYFASDTLIHNCNARYAYHEDRLWVGSHHNCKKPNGEDIWNQVARKNNFAERLAKFPGLVFFGEVYGQVQKGFSYGLNGKSDFILFDIYDISRGRYLDYEDFVQVAESVGLPTTPVLYRGTWQSFDETIEAIADGDSALGDHIREGFVLRLAKERFDDKLGRVILKLPGQDYLTGRKRDTK